MKLIELVKDLYWPEGATHCAQDDDGEFSYFISKPEMTRRDGGGWWASATPPIVSDISSTISEDWQTTIITREEWEAAQPSTEELEDLATCPHGFLAGCPSCTA